MTGLAWTKHTYIQTSLGQRSKYFKLLDYLIYPWYITKRNIMLWKGMCKKYGSRAYNILPRFVLLDL